MLHHTAPTERPGSLPSRAVIVSALKRIGGTQTARQLQQGGAIEGTDSGAGTAKAEATALRDAGAVHPRADIGA